MNSFSAIVCVLMCWLLLFCVVVSFALCGYEREKEQQRAQENKIK